jgi:hypothetical protein
MHHEAAWAVINVLWSQILGWARNGKESKGRARDSDSNTSYGAATNALCLHVIVTFC